MNVCKEKIVMATDAKYGRDKKRLVVLSSPSGLRVAVTGGHGIDIVMAPGNVHISCERGKEIGILVHETYEENLDSIGDIGLSAMNRAAICFSVGQRGYWRKDASNGIIVYLEKAMREGYVFFLKITLMGLFMEWAVGMRKNNGGPDTST